ncbi:MAG TPA: VOC family protein [Candidatus Saccharimonadales bacterium]|jgi:catechol 2,3-dioxygenase-like lactoylglutathione lyase family enzyme|nr:VOC family protein [Candidatus Saccharimonadales bacterium]
MKLKRIDHIGVVVNDLAPAKEFFLDFGFTIQGEAEEQSELLDKVTGFKNAKSRIVFLQAPNGQINLELTQFINPASDPASPQNFIYSHGMQHLAFVIEDIEGIVAAMKQKGYEVFVDIYNYQDMYKLCYFRGPEGIILELVEEL